MHVIAVAEELVAGATVVMGKLKKNKKNLVADV